MYDYCTKKTTVLYNKPEMKVTVLVEKLLMNPNNS